MSILIIAEHNYITLSPATQSTITAAKQISSNIHILIAGDNCKTVAQKASETNFISKIIKAEAPHLKYFQAEEIAPIIQNIASNYSHILAPENSFGKNILPRAAALLDMQQISDVIKIVDKETFIYPVYTGNALATVRSTDSIKFITIRLSAFDQEEKLKSSKKATIEKQKPLIEEITVPDALNLSRFVKQEAPHSEMPDLSSAKIVIAGGHGLGSKENFQMIETLAKKLGAAIGASRAAVDAGYVQNSLQIGQTGKVISPDLYIAIGLSGADQHLSGIKDSKIIVAINKDKDAPIFSVADYGLVADLFEVLPELEEKI